MAIHFRLPLLFFALWLQSGAATMYDVSVENLRASLEGPFGVNRHHLTNPSGKAAARDHIISTFRQYGLEVTVQNFTAPSASVRGNAGTNIIGVKRGKLNGTSDDKIVAVGAHYDTVSNSPGVDDDGSGMAAMLEIARVMTSSNEQNFTTIFVAFDHEENAPPARVAIGTPCETARGSDDFVCSWLLPFLRSSGGPEFQGIFMLETIMNYDPQPNVQTVPQPQFFPLVRIRILSYVMFYHPKDLICPSFIIPNISRKNVVHLP
ncbi:PREDICTED: probable zinc metalloprotease MGG_02107 [Branchiostoma belcheri]|uniref:Probable zinc metalloprotease MGG_02107 n=1 Tax=Branchiostoma belcheri TaxID=7741 RepID=A0A6P4ZD15_BRABE|nr:PREDICTED: probable zinc metalloprotease MGG_02107 [Branchiostoma belcheri]